MDVAVADRQTDLEFRVSQALELAATPARDVRSEPLIADFEAWDRVGDPLAEAVLREIRRHRLTRSDPLDAVRQLATQGVTAARNFLADVEHVPDWVDFEAMKTGAAFGRRHLLGMAVALHSTLPMTYVDPSVSEVLALTGRLGPRGDYTRRAWETATGFVGALDVEQMKPGGEEWARWVRIRIMHTRVRTGLLSSGKWDTDGGPTAISTVGTAGGVYITGTYRAHVCAAFGYGTEEEVDSWTHMWQWIARILGAPVELIGTTPQNQLEIDIRLLAYSYRTPSATTRQLVERNYAGLAAMWPFSLISEQTHRAIGHYCMDPRLLVPDRLRRHIEAQHDPVLQETMDQLIADITELREQVGLAPDRSRLALTSLVALASRTALRGAALPVVRDLAAAVGFRVLSEAVKRGLVGTDADYSTHMDRELIKAAHRDQR